MNAKKINLRIVTPDKTVVDTSVDAVGAVGSDGGFTALPGHIDFLTDLKPGVLWYRAEGQTRELAVSGGFIEVKPNYASVLADSAEYIEEIDIERAQQAIKRAESLLIKAKAASQSGTEANKAEISQITASLTRAATRLKLAVHRLPR
ncbi:MAG: hypothetical protein AMR96_04575 [Candidatus Adiutrix intracellularis]|jgi:F-type H+-transporting ATPase subunit epsilon|nr:MAG: hypothetical protein AMR96_04575 [Candidatus Adiutrix intracellularis]MDR2827010.1 F0F1 ATP synthase subunit epsilon [Candidatus Adiutrix intracellularis]